MFSLRRHRNTGNEMNEPDAQLPPWDHRHESCQAERRCTHWINFPSRESSFSSLCSRSSSLACLLRMFSLSSSRHFAFSIISCRFRSNSSDESFLLNTKTILSGLLLFQQKKKTNHHLTPPQGERISGRTSGFPVLTALSADMPSPVPNSVQVSFLPNILVQWFHPNFKDF